MSIRIKRCAGIYYLSDKVRFALNLHIFDLQEYDQHSSLLFRQAFENNHCHHKWHNLQDNMYLRWGFRFHHNHCRFLFSRLCDIIKYKKFSNIHILINSNNTTTNKNIYLLLYCMPDMYYLYTRISFQTRQEFVSYRMICIYDTILPVVYHLNFDNR